MRFVSLLVLLWLAAPRRVQPRRAPQNAASAQRQRGVADAEYLYALGRLL